MNNAKFFGFYTATAYNGEKSVQVVEGSAREGFATEKTARAKLAARVDAINAKRAGSAVATHVARFDTSADMLRYLNEANEIVQGR